MSSDREVASLSTSAADVAGQVTVKTQDGELFQVELPVISQSKTFLPDWCKDHVGVPEPVIQEDPATRERIWFELNDAEKTFYNVPMEQIVELLLAANYLDIKSLYLYGCQTVAALMKNKSPEEVRELLQLEDDMTEEEKDTIRKENVWCQY
uniref:Skp1-related protein n=1 Tax=Ditylenchus dipsaci TaxID=166011 RepID=A0A915DF82_9BILA